MAKTASKKPTTKSLPQVTIVIEWENAIDVQDKWTRAAMAALESEIAEVAPRMTAKPRIMYLYDKNAVDPGAIEQTLATTGPRLKDLADLEIIPTDGLTYYKLKNFGISRAKTELSIMLDSDAAPQPGWLENLIKPFADPKIMAVGGFTVLGADDFLSKTFALSWIFDLRSEREKTVKREKIHANNCAVRTDFFRENPFPDLPAFKKQCGFWLRDLSARGYQYTRTADAMTVHAPHPGYSFLVWRAWTWVSIATTRPSRPRRVRASAVSPSRSSSSAARSARAGGASGATETRSSSLSGSAPPPCSSVSASTASASPGNSAAPSPAASNHCPHPSRNSKLRRALRHADRESPSQPRLRLAEGPLGPYRTLVQVCDLQPMPANRHPRATIVF